MFSLTVSLALAAGANAVAAGEQPEQVTAWRDSILRVPYAVPPPPKEPVLQVVRQDAETLQRNHSVIGTPLRIGSRDFARGLGSHSVGIIRVYSPDPIERFSAWVGVDHNPRTEGGIGSVTFSVMTADREVFRSDILRGGGEPVRVDVATGGSHALELRMGDAGDGIACDHADWAEAAIVTAGGRTVWLDEMPDGAVPGTRTRYPFSFVYDGKPSEELLDLWVRTARSEQLGDGRTRIETMWTDPATGLRVTWSVTVPNGFAAADWIVYLDSTGDRDTPIIENVQPLDLSIVRPLEGGGPVYRVQSAHGGTPDPTQFEPTLTQLRAGEGLALGAGAGRSSTRNFPFFTLECGGAAAVVAVGWSGCWSAHLQADADGSLRVAAGMERTHFRLHPGERVRSPRILALFHEGDADTAHARFRRLVYAHYTPKLRGKPPLPTLFCNTCFTRGGGWLNECNAENQISLIRAYAPLGAEAIITDAGWFEGGWPNGAGNWNPRKDAYPDGMAPVAKAALDEGIVYGLWFEPERVVAGTSIQKEHPNWLLAAGDGPQGTYLLNFGLPEVQDYFLGIVRGFMRLPGFRVYRQDFNMDPLPYWRNSDGPDREGITEIRYMEGIYRYWERILGEWPDAILEGCASGGHRIDLETVMRFHFHQKTDYWFDYDVDQAALWSVSRYLPNSSIVAHVANKVDEYSFRSALASSLCLGWIADEPAFDRGAASRLTAEYRSVRHLLVGEWYPLLPYSRRPEDWMASQYHRPDLGEGMVLAFRRAASPYSEVQVSLRGLEPARRYEVRREPDGPSETRTGEELMRPWPLRVETTRASALIRYRALPE